MASTSVALNGTLPVMRAFTAWRDLFSSFARASWLARFSAAAPRTLSAMRFVSSCIPDRLARLEDRCKRTCRRVAPCCRAFNIPCRVYWTVWGDIGTLFLCRNKAQGHSPEDTQHERAAHLRDLLEPWSLRKLEARTGLGRTYLAGRLNGDQALSISDIEVLAPVIRMTPDELFAELLSVKGSPETQKATARRASGGIGIMHLVEPPAGLEPATCGLQGRTFTPVIDMFEWRKSA